MYYFIGPVESCGEQNVFAVSKDIWFLFAVFSVSHSRFVLKSSAFQDVILSPLVSPRCVAYIGYQIMSRSHTLYIGAIAEETNKKSSCGIVQGILSSVSFRLFIV